MNYLNLLIKVFYFNLDKFIKDPKNFKEFINIKIGFILESIDSLLVVYTRTKCLQKPGTHDYLLKLGESFCILHEAIGHINDPTELKNSRELLHNKLVKLINTSNEFLTYVVKGFVSYYKSLLDLNDQLYADKDKSVRINDKRVDETVWSIVKENIYAAILNSDMIDDRLNLKTV